MFQSGRKSKFSLFQLFALFRPSADWARATHLRESNLLNSASFHKTDLINTKTEKKTSSCKFNLGISCLESLDTLQGFLLPGSAYRQNTYLLFPQQLKFYFGPRKLQMEKEPCFERVCGLHNHLLDDYALNTVV